MKSRAAEAWTNVFAYQGQDDAYVITFELFHQTTLNVNPGSDEDCAERCDSPAGCHNSWALVLGFPGVGTLNYVHLVLLYKETNRLIGKLAKRPRREKKV